MGGGRLRRGVGGGGAGAPVNNPLLNDIWVDPLSQRSYDNMMEAAISEQREMTQRYVQQSDFMLQMYMTAMIKQQVKREAGRKRIAKELATTGFVPAGASPMAAQLAAKFTDPKQQALAAQSVAGQLGHFQAAATARGGAVKSDAADIFAVAFVLDFEVVNDGGGEPPGGAAEVACGSVPGPAAVGRGVSGDAGRRAADARRADRAGGPGGVRATRGREAGQRRYARRMAREAAQANLNQLKDLWGHPPSGVELTPNGFGDRGERLRAQGKATTTFQLTAEPILPAFQAVTPATAGGGAEAAKKAADDLRAFGEHASAPARSSTTWPISPPCA